MGAMSGFHTIIKHPVSAETDGRGENVDGRAMVWDMMIHASIYAAQCRGRLVHQNE